jgi:hypothetical protein
MENTTNINDLPIDPNPPSSMELPEQNIRQNPPMDQSVYLEPEIKKKVRFSPLIEKNSSIQEKHKILLLATLFFLLFSDTKVKNYLMNIMVVIFGEVLRTSGGGSSKIGQVAYAILYGVSLLLLISFIDLSTLTL